MYEVVASNPEMKFDPDRGMDVRTLFDSAWSRTVPMHQISFSTIRLRTCSGCKANAFSTFQDNACIMPARDDTQTRRQQLQGYFKPWSPSNVKACSDGGGTPTNQRAVLDRMPELLLWTDNYLRDKQVAANLTELVRLEFDIVKKDAKGHSDTTADVRDLLRRTRV